MNDVLIQFLSSILMALGSFVAAYAIYFIKKATAKVHAETEKLQDDKQKALANNAIDRIDTLAEKTVGSIEQQVAGAMREAVKDGKVDRAELVALGQKAVEDVYAQLTDDSKAVLESEMTDIKKYISDVVEDAVGKLKIQ